MIKQSADAAVSGAIARWQLNSRDPKVGGWMGFDQKPWVQKVYHDHPEARELASSCSSSRPGYEEKARDIFEHASPQDRVTLGDYFLGKLALEELSCRAMGAGAGMCDKRTAYLKIWDIAQDYR